ncbi:BTB/POZ domain-containing protein At3g22104-like [Impatiens glandulifera]|uniref:BTB/POZ domain-containing protein At3g22104-like n=1 Tax=Impatiens glandulifera TaxID=253017 RepID=UPI001FB0910E|nr:BTB/POZ domain-containing protein At3g22104-like [Impatiens glandulifera]
MVSSCSRTLRKLCRNMKENPKIIFHDFPGGADVFELVLRFCYSNPRILKTTPFNVFLLKSAADYLKMEDLAEQTVRYIEGSIVSWKSPELLTNMKQSFMNTFLIKKVVQTMLVQKFDHSIISLFLFHYQRSKEFKLDKRRAVEVVIKLLFCLDRNLIPCKALFGLLGTALRLKIRTSCMKKLELMVSSKLDEAKVDDLLVMSSSPLMMFDVNLVLRLVKSFVRIMSSGLMYYDNDDGIRMKKVGRLVDLYLMEVSPDPYLRVSKFLALAMALPDSARESHDSICQAIDLYLDVHGNGGKLSEMEKMELCSVLNYEMVSIETLAYFLQNKHIPRRMLMNVLASQEDRLKGLVYFRVLFDSARAKSGRDDHSANAHCAMGDGLRIYVCEFRKSTKEMEKLKQCNKRKHKSLHVICS